MPRGRACRHIVKVKEMLRYVAVVAASFLPFGSQSKCQLLREALSDPLTLLVPPLYLLYLIYFLFCISFGLPGSCLSLPSRLKATGGYVVCLVTARFSVSSTGSGTQ